MIFNNCKNLWELRTLTRSEKPLKDLKILQWKLEKLFINNNKQMEVNNKKDKQKDNNKSNNNKLRKNQRKKKRRSDEF